MKLKSYVRYLLYALAIFFLVLLHQHLGAAWKESYYKGYEPNFLYFYLSLISMVFAGMVLGLDHFRSVWKQEGKWKINIPKLVLWGIPSLLFSLSYRLLFIQTENLFAIISPIFFLFPHAPTYTPLFQLILGYTILTSFRKESRLSEVQTSSSPS